MSQIIKKNVFRAFHHTFGCMAPRTNRLFANIIALMQSYTNNLIPCRPEATPSTFACEVESWCPIEVDKLPLGKTRALMEHSKVSGKCIDA